MLINLRNALMAGKRKPTAKDYIGADVALWHGFENDGWGRFDPTKTSWVDLRNNIELAPISASISAGDQYSWANGGWRRVGVSRASGSIPWFDGGATPETKYTTEILFSDSSAAGPFSTAFGYTHGIGHELFIPADNSSMVDYTGSNYIDIAMPTGWNFPPTLFTFVTRGIPQTNSRTLQAVYKNGQLLNISRMQSVPTGGALAIFSTTRRNWPSQRDTTFFGVRVTSRELTDSEVATNYAIDKAIFNLPDVN